MLAFTSLLSLLLIIPRVLSVNTNATCATLKTKLPVFYSSKPFSPFSPLMTPLENGLSRVGSPEYTEAMVHYSAVNVQHSACVVQPATPSEIATIVGVFPTTNGKRLTSLCGSSGQLPLQEHHSLYVRDGTHVRMIAPKFDAQERNSVGQRWWPRDESRILFDHRCSYQHEEILSDRLQFSGERGHCRRRVDLG